LRGRLEGADWVVAMKHGLLAVSDLPEELVHANAHGSVDRPDGSLFDACRPAWARWRASPCG